MKTRLLIILFFGIFSLNAQTTHQIFWKIGVNGEAASKTIEVGDTVEWIWDDASVHTVSGIAGSSVEPNFDSGPITGVGMVYSKTFTVEGVNDYRCSIHTGSMFGTITVQNSLGLENETFKTFKFFPNPSNSIINLIFPQYIIEGNVSIIDVSGKKLVSKSFNDANSLELDVSNLFQGIYFIKVKSGSDSQIKQFVKN